MTLIAVAVLSLQSGVVFDQGAFISYVKGVPIAQEGFKILDNGKSSSILYRMQEGQLIQNGKTEFTYLMGSLSSASVNVGLGPTSLSVMGDLVRYGDGSTVRFNNSQKLLAVENYAWHSLTALVRAYEPSGGEQAFQVLVPAIKFLSIWMLERKEQPREIQGRTFIEWKLTVEGAGRSLWTDVDGKLMAATVPDLELQIVRKGYEFLVGGGAPPEPSELQPNRERYNEREVSVMTGSATTLAGTLSVPKGGGRYPAILLISGSGPQDRDWNAAPDVTSSLGLQLADHLSGSGFVVLRYDDRGVGASTGQKYGATLPNLSADVRSLAAFLKAQPEVDPFKVVLLGHSEGGTVATIVAGGDATIGGLILLAAPSRPMDVILLEQVRAQMSDERLPQSIRDAAAAMLPKVESWIAKAKAGERGVVDGTVSLDWLRSAMSVDPAQALERVRCPVLILQGLDDLQVLSRNAADMESAAKAANLNVTTVMLPGVTHYFTAFPSGGGFGSTRDGLADPKLFEQIIEWMRLKVSGS